MSAPRQEDLKWFQLVENEWVEEKVLGSFWEEKVKGEKKNKNNKNKKTPQPNNSNKENQAGLRLCQSQSMILCRLLSSPFKLKAGGQIPHVLKARGEGCGGGDN